MQGIQLYEYKSLLDSLCKIKAALQGAHSPERKQEIEAEEKLLKDIYRQYTETLGQLGLCIKAYESRKLAIRRLLKQQKQMEKQKPIAAKLRINPLNAASEQLSSCLVFVLLLT